MGAAEWWGALCGTGEPSSLHNTILWEVRLPRTLTAIAAGALLGWLGMLLQTWFRNPLAGPGVLGITSGGSLGVALAVLTGLTMPTWIAASAGCLTVLVLIAAAAKRFVSPVTTLVFGLMVSYAVGSAVTLLQASASAESLQSFVFWGMGTFGKSTMWQADRSEPSSWLAPCGCCVELAGWTCGRLGRTWPKPWAFLPPNSRANCSCWLGLWWGGSLRCAAPWRSSDWRPPTCTSFSARPGATAP